RISDGGMGAAVGYRACTLSQPAEFDTGEEEMARIRAPNRRSGIGDRRLQASGFRLQASGFRLQASDRGAERGEWQSEEPRDRRPPVPDRQQLLDRGRDSGRLI